IDAAQLQEALNELPEVFRTPIILYYFEDFSYRDIAEQMDLAMGTVMSRLARAKAHLRVRLAPAEAAADVAAAATVETAATAAPPLRRANHGLQSRPPAVDLRPRSRGPGPERGGWTGRASGAMPGVRGPGRRGTAFRRRHGQGDERRAAALRLEGAGAGEAA